LEINEDVEGTWELRITRNQFIAEVVEEEGLSQDEAAAYVALMEEAGVTFPMLFAELVFTVSRWTYSVIVDFEKGTKEEVLAGSYFVTGNFVVMNVDDGGEMTGTVRDKTLTVIEEDGARTVFSRK